MDIDDIRILITVVSFVTFVGIVLWAWSSRQRENFREAANLPFADDDTPPPVAVQKILRRSAAGGRS